MTTKNAGLTILAIATAAGNIPHAAAQNCQWDPAPTGPGVVVRELVEYDGRLYASGTFASRVMNWDGLSWNDPFIGLNRTANAGASAVWDDGSGPSLFLGGTFEWPANKLARWNGNFVTDIGGSFFGTSAGQSVITMAVWNNALYVGGAFNTTHSTSPSVFDRIARWDGTTLSDVGGGTNGLVWTMSVFQNDLYLFGNFTEAGGVATGRAARWDGATFHPVPFEIPSGAAISGSLVWDDGSGEALYLHGSFATILGTTVNGIGRWDGSQWTALGDGATRVNGTAAWINAATIFHDGISEKLYIGSHNTNHMTHAGGTPAERLAWWDGTSWSGAATGVDHTIFTLRQFDDPMTGEPVLWVGGQFDTEPGISHGGIARWVCDPVQPPTCYADCDGDGTLNINDFLCFIDEFAQAQTVPPAQQQTHYANCTGATAEPFLTVNDFLCFIDEFAQGCP